MSEFNPPVSKSLVGSTPSGVASQFRSNKIKFNLAMIFCINVTKPVRLPWSCPNISFILDMDLGITSKESLTFSTVCLDLSKISDS